MDKNKELETADVPWEDPIAEDFHVAVFKEKNPVTFGHLVFVPKYNTPEVIQDAFYSAFKSGLDMVKSGMADGFNIGMDVGKAAGQTIMYPHIHVIPRFNGESKDPVGGMRTVVPVKGKYKN